jgi:hypothetical protein
MTILKKKKMKQINNTNHTEIGKNNEKIRKTTEKKRKKHSNAQRAR